MWPSFPSGHRHILISTHTSRVGCDYCFCNLFHRHSHFYSHIPCGMWLLKGNWLPRGIHFYSHIPCGMWHVFMIIVINVTNFYSHIPCGMWLSCCYGTRFRLKFLLTHPVWDVTPLGDKSTLAVRFLLTHPVWDVTRPLRPILPQTQISTHTSRVGCDKIWPTLIIYRIISTHTSRVGCDWYTRGFRGIP